MQMNDKQNITIQLAGLPRIPLKIAAGDEEIYRKAERWINESFARFSKAFANEPPMEIMARVAFQNALSYLRSEKRQEAMKELDRELDSLLQNLPGLE